MEELASWWITYVVMTTVPINLGVQLVVGSLLGVYIVTWLRRKDIME